MLIWHKSLTWIFQFYRLETNKDLFFFSVSYYYFNIKLKLKLTTSKSDAHVFELKVHLFIKTNRISRTHQQCCSMHNITLSLQDGIVSTIFFPVYLLRRRSATHFRSFPISISAYNRFQRLVLSGRLPTICPLYLFIRTLERIAITATSSY